MKFIFLGHACFQIDTGKEKLLFDPFLTGNGLAEEAASKVECDYIFLSHAHADHFGDAIAIAEWTGAKVIAIPEVIGLFPKTVINFQPMNLGGTFTAPFGKENSTTHTGLLHFMISFFITDMIVIHQQPFGAVNDLA